MSGIKQRWNKLENTLNLDKDDKTRLIEILLIVGSLMVAFKTPENIATNYMTLKDSNMTVVFSIFALSSVLYFILIQKGIKNTLTSFNLFVVSMSFSVLLASILAINAVKSLPSLLSQFYAYLSMFLAYTIVFSSILFAALRIK